MTVRFAIMPFSSRSGLLAALVLSPLLAAGCLFPEYTFDEAEPSGGNGGTGANTGGEPVGAGDVGGTGGSGAAGGMGGEGGSGGSPPEEDCFTPGDEDNDGDEDCADADCAPDLECVDPIPVGWGTYGYTALFLGSVTDPACPAGAETGVYTGHAGLQNEDAACTACACGNPTGQGCELSNDFDPVKGGIQPFYARDVACNVATATNQTTLTVPAGWDLVTCSGLDVAAGGGACPGPNCNASVRAQSAVVTSGTCEATGGEPSGGDPAWNQNVKACRVDAGLGGCDVGKTCVVKPSNPYEERICIGKAGDQTCPSGFTLRNEAFADYADSRECSDCACGASAGGSCKITIQLHSNAGTGCTTALATVETGQCTNLVGNPRISGRTATVTTPPSGGSCAVVGGGVPSGSVTPIDQTTFCCLPPD